MDRFVINRVVDCVQAQEGDYKVDRQLNRQCRGLYGESCEMERFWR